MKVIFGDKTYLESKAGNIAVWKRGDLRRLRFKVIDTTDLVYYINSCFTIIFNKTTLVGISSDGRTALHETFGTVIPDYLLMEDGSYLLKEDEGKFILQGGA